MVQGRDIFRFWIDWYVDDLISIRMFNCKLELPGTAIILLFPCSYNSVLLAVHLAWDIIFSPLLWLLDWLMFGFGRRLYGCPTRLLVNLLFAFDNSFRLLCLRLVQPLPPTFLLLWLLILGLFFNLVLLGFPLTVSLASHLAFAIVLVSLFDLLKTHNTMYVVLSQISWLKDSLQLLCFFYINRLVCTIGSKGDDTNTKGQVDKKSIDAKPGARFQLFTSRH